MSVEDKPKIKRIADLEEQEDMIRTQLMLPESMFKQLGIMAVEKHMSKGAIVREALRLYFKADASPDTSGKVSDEDLNEILDECTTFFGGFYTTDPDEDTEGFFTKAQDRGIKLKDLTEPQLERVTDKLIIGYKGFFDKPSIDEFMEWVSELEPTPEYTKALRKELEESESEDDEEEEW